MLDLSLSDVVALAEKPPERLVRFADQPQWKDPVSGHRRRHASPADAASGIEIIVVDLPADARVSYSPWGRNAFTQQLLCWRARSACISRPRRCGCAPATASTST